MTPYLYLSTKTRRQNTSLTRILYTHLPKRLKLTSPRSIIPNPTFTLYISPTTSPMKYCPSPKSMLDLHHHFLNHHRHLRVGEEENWDATQHSRVERFSPRLTYMSAHSQSSMKHPHLFSSTHILRFPPTRRPMYVKGSILNPAIKEPFLR